MNNALKYVTDSKGHTQSVQVPIQQWEELNDKYALLLNKVKIMTDIKKGFDEIKQAKKTGKKLQTLQDFIDENSH